MRARRLSRTLLALAAATLLPAGAYAGGASAPPAGTVDGRAWLDRIHGAASQRNYQGTLVHSAGGAVSSSRIVHYAEGRQTFERIEMLDGQPRQVLRHNEVVQTWWPQRRQVVIERRDALVQFPALLQDGEEQLFERYELVPEGVDRVAGHDSLVFLLRPRDLLRFAQRLWAERVSGLLLRTDVLASNGRVLESSAFTEVSIGIKPQPDSVLLPMKKLDGYSVLRPSFARTQLAAEGWQLQSPVAGFHQASCVKRLLGAGVDPQAVPSEAAPSDVLQAIFSDGLTHVSVFIEPYNAARHKPVAASIGATHTLMNQQGDWWVTVMGDVPMATLKQFAGALERRP
jgi:sigma-E factor negative regulatory protein RseB